jgi:hypothetical protein
LANRWVTTASRCDGERLVPLPERKDYAKIGRIIRTLMKEYADE